VGHFSKECPKPRDYSKVQCKNCGEMGHTVVRCKKPAASGDSGFGGDFGGGDSGKAATGGWEAGGAGETVVAGGWEDAGTTATNGAW